MGFRLSSITSTLWVIARVGLVTYVAVLALLWLQQRHFIYYPERESFDELQKSAAAQAITPWLDSKGNPIGWLSKPPLGIATYRCLVFHGNAGYALRRTYIIQGMQTLSEKSEWETYLLEYPGYGAREGSPSEESLVQAGVQAVDALREKDSRPIFIIGESLGSGVAAQVAAQRPDIIAGILFITPFDSMTHVAWSHYRIIPNQTLLRFILKDRYESDRALKNYDGPIAFLIAGSDTIIPGKYSNALFDSYHGPKKKWVQPDVDHNDLNFSPFADWWQEVFAFLTSKAIITKF